MGFSMSDYILGLLSLFFNSRKAEHKLLGRERVREKLHMYYTNLVKNVHKRELSEDLIISHCILYVNLQSNI